ncbi:MAG: DJ-1/PfpI family protein [Terrimicrobiaceae bacterium]|nr:DJ-1/PfpI family protein [Terrimicrobiaceae bacterium]
MTARTRKVGVLIEDHFDATEYRMFLEFFPQHGIAVDFLTHLWGNPELKFGSNSENDRIEEHVVVSRELNDTDPADYAGILLIGGYAMDRLRYQVAPRKGEPNQSPALVFLRKAMRVPGLKVGAICHALWLLCADPTLLRGRKVTCAHNILCDVENAGGECVYGPEGLADVVVDGNLVSGKHPGVTAKFLDAFLAELG